MSSILADFSQPTDSQNFFTLNGLPGILSPQKVSKPHPLEYAPITDPKDPVLSPIFADLHGMPPSLLVHQHARLALSNTTIFHRALLRAGDDAQLVVYESLSPPSGIIFSFPKPAKLSN